MKIILITGCNDCPHGVLWSNDDYGMKFTCKSLKEINCSPCKPLGNCPLDDAEEKIITIFKQLEERKNINYLKSEEKNGK